MASVKKRGDIYYFRHYIGTDSNGKQMIVYDKES